MKTGPVLVGVAPYPPTPPNMKKLIRLVLWPSAAIALLIMAIITFIIELLEWVYSTGYGNLNSWYNFTKNTFSSINPFK
jgi:hypothetical protein